MGIRKHAPGPSTRQILGSLNEAQSNPLQFYMNLRQEYGDVVRVRVGPFYEWYLITHPEGVEHVLQSNQRNYRKGKFVTRQMGLLTGKGLLTSEGDFWRRQRRIAQPAFQRNELSAVASLTAEVVERTAQRWVGFAEKNQTVDLTSEMKKLSLEIVSRALFSKDVSGEVEAVERAVIGTLDYINRRLSSYPFIMPRFIPTGRNRQFEKELRYLDGLVYRIIGERRLAKTNTKDLLSLLLNAHDEKTGEVMSDTQLRDEVLSLLMAGYETTAAAIACALSLLTFHPEAERKLYAELTTVLEERAPSFEDLPRLAYTRTIIQESLRLYPPVPAQPRQAIGDDEVGGYSIPAGATIIICQHVTHRHPDFWDDPDVFDPERFTPERSAGRPHFAYFPFGGGGRQCIGKDFATSVAILTLARLARTFRLEFTSISLADSATLLTLRPQLMCIPKIRSDGPT